MNAVGSAVDLRRLVCLEDIGGTPVAIRPIRPDDAGRQLAFVEGLSRLTRYRRFLSARRLLPGELHRLVNVDFDRDMALVATIRIDEVEVQIGVARYVRLDDPAFAEFAIVLADAWQGRRLGERLMRHLIDAAQARGLAGLTGMTLTDNDAMLKLARRLGARVRLEPDDATVTRIDIPLRVAA